MNQNIVIKLREVWVLLNDSKQPVMIDGGESKGILIFSSENMAKSYNILRHTKCRIIKVSIPDLIAMASYSVDALAKEGVTWMILDNMGMEGEMKHIPIASIASIPEGHQAIRLSFTRASQG